MTEIWRAPKFLRMRKPADLPGGYSRRQLALALDYVRENPGVLDEEDFKPKKFRFRQEQDEAFDISKFCVVIDGKYYLSALYVDGKYMTVDGSWCLETSLARRVHRREKIRKKREATERWLGEKRSTVAS